MRDDFSTHNVTLARHCGPLVGMTRVMGLFLLILGFLTGCAQQTYHTDAYNQKQYGATYPVKIFEGQNDKPEAAGVAVVLSGLGLAANPDYYKSETISGRCVVAHPEGPAFDLACGETTIILVDRNSGARSHASTVRGEFAFKVPPNKEFRLKIDSKEYVVVDRSVAGVFERGDQAVIRVKANKPAGKKKTTKK